jgi:hypothetical protein
MLGRVNCAFVSLAVPGNVRTAQRKAGKLHWDRLESASRYIGTVQTALKAVILSTRPATLSGPIKLPEV